MEIKVGMQAINLVEYIFIEKGLRLLEVVKYRLEEKPHFAEAKKSNPKAKRTVAKALQHTPDFNNPMLFLQSLEDLFALRVAMSHLRDIDPGTVEVASYTEDEDKKLHIHEALSVTSRVRTLDGISHIPLLDMDLPIDEASPAEAEEVAHGLGVHHGAIVNSGKSYHFWGLNLLQESEWRSFMYRALLLDRVDSRWIGHRMIDGHASLRISEKRGVAPTIVHIF